jgi:hypothetical protein
MKTFEALFYEQNEILDIGDQKTGTSRNTKLVLNGEFAGLMGRIFCSNWLQFL